MTAVSHPATTRTTLALIHMEPGVSYSFHNSTTGSTFRTLSNVMHVMGLIVSSIILETFGISEQTSRLHSCIHNSPTHMSTPPSRGLLTPHVGLNRYTLTEFGVIMHAITIFAVIFTNSSMYSALPPSIPG